MTREEAIKIMQTERACVLKATSTFAPCNRECYSCDLYLDRLEIAGAYTAAIEALQERPKGRWIKLPCEIGDTVWFIPKYVGNPLGMILKDKVQMIGVTSRGIHFKLRNHHDHNKMYMFGKTVFLTKEEAEKALADMR